MNTRHIATRIEPLEPRVAPAVIIDPGNPKIATYADEDGDEVTIKVSKGTLTPANFTTTPSGAGDRLDLVDLSVGFAGTNLSIVAKRAGAGDGAVVVSRINSGTLSLGKVFVDGDLRDIDVGNVGGVAGLALKSLTVTSFNFSQGTFATSNIAGDVGSIVVKSGIHVARIIVSGGIGKFYAGGSLYGAGDAGSGGVSFESAKSIFIGGSLISGASSTSGGIVVSGNTRTVTIGGSVIGVDMTADLPNGVSQVNFSGDVAKLKIGGSLVSGASNGSGGVTIGGKAKSVTIAGSIIGGDGDHVASVGGLPSGQLTISDAAGSVIIGGTLKGGAGGRSGGIGLGGPTGKLSIGGDLSGGSGSLSANVFATGRIKTVTIGGSIISGANNNGTGLRLYQGADSILVKGDLLGRPSEVAAIYGIGTPVTSENPPVLFPKITIRGDVEGGMIMAGYSGPFLLAQPDQVIGTVTIGGNFLQSRLMSGVTQGNDLSYGTVDDFASANPSGVFASAIKKVVIAGMVRGDANPVVSYGIQAERIGEIILSGDRLKGEELTGTGLLIGIYSDVRLRQLPVT